MKIELQRRRAPFLLEACNNAGNRLLFDGSSEAGGGDGGFRPMEGLMASLAACASIDLVRILQKQRQELVDLSISVDGDRKEGVEPAPFTAIKVTFRLHGDIDRTKAERAAELAMTKYCSVGASLDSSITVTHQVEIHSSVAGKAL